MKRLLRWWFPATCLALLLTAELLKHVVAETNTVSVLLSAGTDAPTGHLVLAAGLVVLRLVTVLIVAPALLAWIVMTVWTRVRARRK